MRYLNALHNPDQGHNSFTNSTMLLRPVETCIMLEDALSTLRLQLHSRRAQKMKSLQASAQDLVKALIVLLIQP